MVLAYCRPKVIVTYITYITPITYIPLFVFGHELGIDDKLMMFLNNLLVSSGIPSQALDLPLTKRATSQHDARARGGGLVEQQRSGVYGAIIVQVLLGYPVW